MKSKKNGIYSKKRKLTKKLKKLKKSKKLKKLKKMRRKVGGHQYGDERHLFSKKTEFYPKKTERVINNLRTQLAELKKTNQLESTEEIDLEIKILEIKILENETRILIYDINLLDKFLQEKLYKDYNSSKMIPEKKSALLKQIQESELQIYEKKILLGEKYISIYIKKDQIIKASNPNQSINLQNSINLQKKSLEIIKNKKLKLEQQMQQTNTIS